MFIKTLRKYHITNIYNKIVTTYKYFMSLKNIIKFNYKFTLSYIQEKFIKKYRKIVSKEIYNNN
jgi:hypothetical protein